jgi:hypothetical protein
VTPTTGERQSLRRAAKAFRAFHIGLALVDLVALTYIWVCGLSGRRDRFLSMAIGALVVEGAALVVGRGNCPLGPLQARVGDPTPLFELVLPKRAAKAAVPVLCTVSVAGIALIVGRGPVVG